MTFIIKLDGQYLAWGTVTDSPMSFGMNLEELRAWAKEMYGQQGDSWVDDRLPRVETSGSSSHNGSSAEDIIEGNAAGPSGMALTKDEILEFYFRHKERPTCEALAQYQIKRDAVET